MAGVDMFARAMAAMSQLTGKPLLFGPDNKPLMPTAHYTLRRDAAKNVGSFKNWRPQAVFSSQAEAMERAAIVERSTDLYNNDPHVAGIVDGLAALVIGSTGLAPDPMIDRDALPDMTIEQVRALQAQMRNVYDAWAPAADAAGRMHHGMIQYLERLSLLRYGEYFTLLHMVDDPGRPYMLGCRVLHPLRVKTPIDMTMDPRIRDGIELGEYGQAVAIWVKKSGGSVVALPDISTNFMRIPMRLGHRPNVIHGFVVKEPEQVRGWPFLSPAMKYLRDLNDLLSAELVSNVVTAALTYFIEVSAGDDPWGMANSMASHVDPAGVGPDGRQRFQRYQETYPGAILYGNTGEKPHLLSASRPGTTFDPFITTVKKSISMACNMPYVVLFKDVQGTNFAGFRSAMLDAWRIVKADRKWHASVSCQPVYSMLMEEAWLRGQIDYGPDFYTHRTVLTRADWRGAPKGDIEPVKAAEADIKLIGARLKTRAQACRDRGYSFRDIIEDLEEEKQMLEDAGLSEEQASQTIESIIKEAVRREQEEE